MVELAHVVESEFFMLATKLGLEGFVMDQELLVDSMANVFGQLLELGELG
jgi:hypothetical protein